MMTKPTRIPVRSMWRHVTLVDGPLEGRTLALRSDQMAWQDAARLDPGADELLATPPAGGIYVLQANGTKMNWVTELELPAEEEKYFAQAAEAARRVAHVVGDQRGVTGTIVCPRCDGTLEFRTAPSNGHVSARCLTLNCIRWIE